MRNLLKRTQMVICTAVAKRQVKSYGRNLRVNKLSRFTKNTSIGSYCNFNGIRVTGHGNITFGDYFHSGTMCQIISSFHNYDYGKLIPYDETYIDKNVTIEDFVWIGNNVIILGGVTLGEGCIIQAGSVVVNNIPSYAIAGGSPAKVFKYRDIDHFVQLKRQGKFY